MIKNKLGYNIGTKGLNTGININHPVFSLSMNIHNLNKNYQKKIYTIYLLQKKLLFSQVQYYPLKI